MNVLFFSPFANIWEHAFPEALIAESFAQKDIDVEAVRCGRIFQSHCVAMSAVGVGPDAPLATRLQVCAGCEKRRDLITDQMHIPALILDAWVRDEDRNEIERLIGTIGPSTWPSLQVDGIALGRYAIYEMWLNNKLVSTDLSPEMWQLYLGQLRNTLFSYFAGRRILQDRRPDAVVVYNDHYSVNHAFCAAAEKLGIATYTIHGGQHMIRRAETMMMSASGHTMEDVFNSEAWRAYQTHPIGESEVGLVGEHFSGLLAANSAFAYSSQFEGTDAAELRRRLRIKEGSKVLLAAMSSEDELIGVRLIDAIPETTQTSLFVDQFEWIDEVFRYAVAHSEVHLILRLHPRMFPNKREQILSPVVERIMALREGAPRNVTFNMPADGVGLYDLMQVVDVLLNFRSTVGAELSAFGIPVVAPANSDFFTYPSELNRVGHTIEEFRQQIDRAVGEGWSLDNVRRSFRWYSFLFSRLAVDFSDAVSSRPIAIRPKKPGAMLRLYNWAAFVFLQYGPLVRERLALRRRNLAPSSSALLLDVIQERLTDVSESPLWPPLTGTRSDETAALEHYLLNLADTLWADIRQPDSLAERIRTGLAAGAAAR